LAALKETHQLGTSTVVVSLDNGGVLGRCAWHRHVPGERWLLLLE